MLTMIELKSMKKQLSAVLFVVLLAGFVQAEESLEKMFATPPETTKPRCYWYWMNGNVTKDGISRDLEAMKRVGIGEAYIGIISIGKDQESNSQPKALTDEWWSFIEYAVREGGRIGVDIGLFNSPGWSQSGGPWVKPSQAMRYVVLPETRVHGPQKFEGKLPAPEGDFQDIAVLAFPATEESLATETARTPTLVSFEAPMAFTARSLTVKPAKLVRVTAELQASDDGQNYRTVKKFVVDRHRDVPKVGPVPFAPVVATFPAATARFFRLKFSAPCALDEVRLSSLARVESYADKSLLKMFQEPLPPFDFYTWSKAAEPDVPVTSPSAVRDLSKDMSADGTLRWDVPEGEWIVLRAGMVPTGTRNVPAPSEATGLEVDKMSRPALKAHFEAYIGELLRRMPEAERGALKHVVADSYEVGPENWTDDFAQDFQQRYGYDPLRWLPVLTGRILGSADQSDRFLWDLRRLVADRIARDYVGGLRDLCHQHGLKMWLENYGHWGFASEFLLYGGNCDEVSGEFWANGTLGSVELRDAASAAHIYGKNVVWAEAFTGGPAFANTPRELKPKTDWAFCEGINQFMLHVYIHQPWEEKRPGVNAGFGTEFNRHNTWFPFAKPWVDYLRRCSVLLQAGTPVADVAYFIGEDAPKMAGLRQPELPAGYDCDYINADVLLHRAQVKDGRLVLPDGMSYTTLVLPPSETMRPEMMKRIAEFTREGLPVTGAVPNRSPSLEKFPACDVAVRRWAEQTALRSKLELPPPDLICPPGIIWKHRRDGETDIYFLSNKDAKPVSVTASFRVNGKTSQLWHPDTGEIEDADGVVRDGRTEVSVDLEQHGSVFVVFREGKVGGRNTRAQDRLPEGREISGPWEVEFPARRARFEKLISWTERGEPDIKYFSGAATYRTTFNIVNKGRMILDLGRVEALATVTVNGKEFPTLWKPPYQVDITDALKPGTNELAVTVVNAWLNRLIGDAALPAEKRSTWLSSMTVKADSPLQPSGLLGPVRLYP